LVRYFDLHCPLAGQDALLRGDLDIGVVFHDAELELEVQGDLAVEWVSLAN
jgi:hypothetical protein